MRPSLRILLLGALLLLAGCQDERQRTAFCENEGVRLLVGGSIAFSYEPNSCQLAFSRDLREFRAYTDTMSDFFVATFAPLVMDDGLVAVAPGLENDIGCLGPGIQYHKADVVSRCGVLGTDVAKSDHQITLVSHGGVGFTPPQQPQ